MCEDNLINSLFYCSQYWQWIWTVAILHWNLGVSCHKVLKAFWFPSLSFFLIWCAENLIRMNCALLGDFLYDTKPLQCCSAFSVASAAWISKLLFWASESHSSVTCLISSVFMSTGCAPQLGTLFIITVSNDIRYITVIFSTSESQSQMKFVYY